MSNLYSMKNYLADIPFAFSTFIREYDIRKANISILYSKGILSQTQYNMLLKAPREHRQYIIGNLQKDERVNEALVSGIIEAKKMFFEQNNISDSSILSIKNDAIFVIGISPQKTKFGIVEFINKNTYTSYLKLMKHLEIYYGLNGITNEEIIDIKGINDKVLLKYHYGYMLDYIAYILNSLETDSLDNIIANFNLFYNQYINLELDIGFYREFNSESIFRLNMQYDSYTNPGLYSMKNTIENKRLLNINYNLNLLMEIYGILSNLYFSINDKKVGR